MHIKLTSIKYKPHEIIPSGLYSFQELSVTRLRFLNLLDVLSVNNAYRLQALKFTHFWHKGLLLTKLACFMISFNAPVKYMDTRQDMHLDKVYTYQKCAAILVNKQLLTQRLFTRTKSLLILKISILQLLETSETLFTLWITIWKLVYAPFPQFYVHI